MLPYSPSTKPLGCQLHPSSPHPPPLATLQVSCYGAMEWHTAGCINRDLTRQRPFRILSKCGNTIDLKYDMTQKYKLSCHASVHECCCKWLIPPCIDFPELSNRVWLVWLSTASAVQTVPFSQLKMNISLLWACASTVSLILVAYVNESEGSIAGNGANVCSRSQRYSTVVVFFHNSFLV